MADWGIKVSKENEDVKQLLTTTSKRNFTLISSDPSLRIESATIDGNTYTVTFLTDIDVSLSISFEADNISNPTEWQAL
jgi:hypothetical protein